MALEANSNIKLSDFYQGFIVTGSNSAQNSGTSVRKAGDVNGDGYSDVVIGAPYGTTYSGTSYVLFGGINLSNIDLNNLTPKIGFSITAAIQNSNSGSSVSGIGDFNNDGFDDVIIGAPGSPNTSLNDNIPGYAYIIYGSSSPSNINLANLTLAQGLSITGASFNSRTGWVVAGAGDFNKDGFDDAIVYASYVNVTGSGETYVIYGGRNLYNINLANFTSSQGFSIAGATTDTNGYIISGAGDVNNDGFSDIIIGVPFGTYPSQASVIYGSSSPSNINLINLTPSQGFLISGISSVYTDYRVSAAGDVNRDGYSDVIIGTDYANSEAGISYVIFGSSSPSNVNLNNLNKEQGFSIYGTKGSYSGYGVSSAGDINGDGYSDIMIYNAYLGNSSNSVLARTSVLYGSALPININLDNLNSEQGFSVFYATPTSYVGNTISGAGDVNKDGYDDIIISTPYANYQTGQTYIIYGNASNDITSSPSLIPTQMPSTSPSFVATEAPTLDPTNTPIFIPSVNPTHISTDIHVHSPTSTPSSAPSDNADSQNLRGSDDTVLVESITIPIVGFIAVALGGYACYRWYYHTPDDTSSLLPSAVAVTSVIAEPIQEAFNFMYHEGMKIVGATAPEMD